MTTATTDVLSLIATLYGVGAATSALLQARQMLRLGSAQAVSARFLAIYAGGYAVWLLQQYCDTWQFAEVSGIVPEPAQV